MIYYFSGTGNSRYVAQLLGEKTGDTVVDIAATMRRTQDPAPLQDTNADATVGFVFPVYGWAPPALALRFLDTMKREETPRYLYFIAVCGDDTGKTGDVFAAAVRRKGWRLDAGFSVTMPNTYVCLPGFDVDNEGMERLKVESVAARIDFIASAVRERRVMDKPDCHEGAFPFLKTHVLGGFFRRFLMSPKRFCTVEETCVGCGKCSKVCPLGNITLDAQERPVWDGNCAHCLACYHACPKHAVDYDGQTRKKGQYRRFMK